MGFVSVLRRRLVGGGIGIGGGAKVVVEQKDVVVKYSVGKLLMKVVDRSLIEREMVIEESYYGRNFGEVVVRRLKHLMGFEVKGDLDGLRNWVERNKEEILKYETVEKQKRVMVHTPYSRMTLDRVIGKYLEVNWEGREVKVKERELRRVDWGRFRREFYKELMIGIGLMVGGMFIEGVALSDVVFGQALMIALINGFIKGGMKCYSEYLVDGRVSMPLKAKIFTETVTEVVGVMLFTKVWWGLGIGVDVMGRSTMKSTIKFLLEAYWRAELVLVTFISCGLDALKTAFKVGSKVQFGGVWGWVFERHWLCGDFLVRLFGSVVSGLAVAVFNVVVEQADVL